MTTTTALEDLIASGVVGARVAVTDGTTTVDPATSLHLPAGTLSDLGAGSAGILTFRVVKATVKFDDAGFWNGGGNDGVAWGTVNAGEIIVRLFAICRTFFSGATKTDSKIALNLGGDGIITVLADSASGGPLYYSALPDFPGDSPSDGVQIFTSTAGGTLRTYGYFASGSEAAIQGEADIYAIIATPAA